MQKDKLNILLIHPEISRTKYNFVGIIENECLELEYISAFLKEKGHNIFLFDGQVEHRSVPDVIKECNSDLVYVCGRTRQENFMLEYCRDAKEFNSDAVTVIGGLHAQMNYQRFFKEEVDYVLSSYDIFTLADIIDRAVYGEDINLSEKNGLYFKTKEGWKGNSALPVDINLLPLPDRSYFYAHPDNYRYLELKHSAWVRTAFSCPYRCKFCERNRMNAGKYVQRDIENVVDEIADIPSENIYIVDDDFLYDEDRLEKFAELIKCKNLKKNIICYGRADFIASHKELMKKLKDVGLYYVLVGLEAINDSHLNDYNKKTNVDINIEAIDICNELGINIMGMFIIDLDFRKKDFRNLYKWINEHSLKHVAVSIFTPEMGLPTFEEYKDRMITDNPSHFDYLHLVASPTNLSVKKFYLYYYILLIKLFLKAKKEGVYDFIDYGDYINSFIMNIFGKRKNDDK